MGGYSRSRWQGADVALLNKPLKADGRTSSCPTASSLSPLVKYDGLARRYLLPPRFLMRPLLNGGTLGGGGPNDHATGSSPQPSEIHPSLRPWRAMPAR